MAKPEAVWYVLANPTAKEFPDLTHASTMDREAAEHELIEWARQGVRKVLCEVRRAA